MATKITITGDTKSADAAIDDVVESLEKGDKAARGFSDGLDEASSSLGKTTQRARAASAQIGNQGAGAMSKMAGAAGGMTTAVGGAATAVAGLGSALGIQGAGLASATVGLGSFGVALGAAVVAGASAVSVYRDLTKTTSDLAESHNFAVQALRDFVLWTDDAAGSVAELNALQKRDAQFAKDQMTRMAAQSQQRKTEAAQRAADLEREISAIGRLVESEKEKARLERFAGRAARRFGPDREAAEQKLIDLATQKAELLKTAANLEGTEAEQARHAREIQADLRTIESERAGIKRGLAESAREELDAAREMAKAEAERRKAASEFAKIQNDIDAANREALTVLEAQTNERKQQLGLLFQAKSAAAPAGGGGVSRGRPRGGGRGGGLLGALGGAGTSLLSSGFQAARATSGVTGGGQGGDSGRGVLDAARALSESEIDKIARRAGVDADIVDAMRAQLAAQKELNAQQEQMAADQKQFRALAEGILNKARGRRQRAGR